MMRGAVWGSQESGDVVRDAEGELRIPRKVERVLRMYFDISSTCVPKWALQKYREEAKESG